MSGEAFKLGQFCHFNLRLVKSYLFVNSLNSNKSSLQNKDVRLVEEAEKPENLDQKSDQLSEDSKESQVIF